MVQKSKLTLNAKNCSTLTKNVLLQIEIMQLLLLYKSGLIDQNVGLEIFDKGDFTLN